MIVKLNS